MGKKKSAVRKRYAPPLDKLMLNEKFSKPIVLVSYDGIQALDTIMKVTDYHILAEDKQGAPVNIEKKYCMFALPLEKYGIVKPYVKRIRDIIDKALGPEKFLYDRRLVQKELPRDEAPVKLYVRNGLSLEGIIVKDDKYHILMRVGGKVVLVWKHAVYSIRNA